MDNSTRLKQIEDSLLGVISAITQTPSKNVQRARMASSIVTAKATSVAATASIFGLVSTLGTAGTGTAIGTLSGAASTSATLAWIGGLVGGGMAAGAVVLPLTGIAAGATATMYLRQKLHGRPRQLEELHPFEDEILFGADNLIHPLEEIANDDAVQPSAEELRVYVHDGLKPLLERIATYLGDPTHNPDNQDGDPLSRGSSLKPKYQKQLRKHYRTLQKHAEVLARPSRISFWLAKLARLLRRKPYIGPSASHLASVTLAITFQRLWDGQLSAFGPESDLVLDALRRSTNELENASLEELSAYIGGLSPEQLSGVVSNTKGIYHELLFVEMYNASGEAGSAQVMEATNFPGADIQFLLDGDVVREVQLKAVNSPTLVYEHLERYPDIEILVTEETASILNGIDSSGLSNAILSRNVTNRLQELQGSGVLDEITDGIIISAFVTSGFVVWNVLKTRDATVVDFKKYLSNAGIAVGTASAIEGAITIAGA